MKSPMSCESTMIDESTITPKSSMTRKSTRPRAMTRATYALVFALAGLGACASTAPIGTASQSAALAGSLDAPLVPMMDRRDTIMATGYAVIGVQNNKNAPQQRLLAIRAAKIDAYRGLAEQVYGLYLDANTIVSEMTVVSDAFRTRVEGVIFGATLISINPVNNDTYEVTLSLNRSAINDLRVLYAEQLSGRRR